MTDQKQQAFKFSLDSIEQMALALGSDDEDDSSSNVLEASTSTGVRSGQVSAVPSGSGMTFLLDSSFESETEPEASTSVLSQGDDDEEAKKKQELTSKYLAGKLSFPDLLREINEEESDDDNEDDEEEDEKHFPSSPFEGSVGDSEDAEWMPSQKKNKSSSKKKTKKKTAKEELDQSLSLFESELNQTQKQQLGKKKKKVGSHRRKRLEPALQGLMGEANMRFARGDKETAIRMCMEVIRQDPSAPEPFQTVADLYEQMGEQEKSLQFALIAAHLAPQDPEEWARLADMSLEMEDLKQAALCYKKAIDADLENTHYHWARCNLLELLKDQKGALRGLKRLLGVLKPHQGLEYLQASKEMARILHAKNDLQGAKTAISDAMSKFPEQIETADVNLLLELLIELEQHDEALEVLCRHCQVKFETSEDSTENLELLDPEKQLKTFKKVYTEENTPIEITCKLIVVLVNLGANHLVKDISQTVLTEDADEFGDLMLEVAESFMKNQCFEQSLPFLQKLTQSKEYSQAAVWLRLGESLFATNQLDEAEQAYKKVVELAPTHLQARRTLSNILHKLGRAEEALSTLSQDEAAELLNPTLLFEKCQLLLKEDCVEEFVGKAKLLFSRHFFNIQNREELAALASSKRQSNRTKALTEVRSFMRAPLVDTSGPAFETQSQISVQDEYQLFRRLCEVLYEQKRFAEFQRITFSALGSPSFSKNTDIARECEFLCLLSSFLNGDSFFAFNFVREHVFKHLHNNRLLNLLAVIISRSDDLRHNKFLMRLMHRNPDSLGLGILNGHNCLVAGTYKYSLGEYMNAFKQDPTNPMIALMLGLTFTHLACQKFSAKKHSLVVQACAFFGQYLKFRGKCQESFYNLGRAMQQLGIFNVALHYYKRALEDPPMVESQPEMFDLRCEIGYNMALIYQHSGAMEMARYYTQKYVVV